MLDIIEERSSKAPAPREGDFIGSQVSDTPRCGGQVMSCMQPCHNRLIARAGATVFVRLWLHPVRRVVGTRAQTHQVLQTVGVEVLAA